MPLVTEEGIVADTYRRLEAGDATGDIIVALADIKDHIGHSGCLGAEVPNTASIEEIAPWLARLDLVCLAFPIFTDGRAYSLARQIRQAGFAGELRATGNLLPDQLQFMAQVGFTAFEVCDRFAPEVWRRALAGMSLSYQAANGNARHVWQERALARDRRQGRTASAR
jgi:uncharacterized protein (DUF934 family)